MQPTPNMGPLVLIFGMFAIMYFMIFLPQKRQQKKQQEMINNLKKNDEVVTFSGIHGTIVNIKEKTFVLRVDDNAKIEIDKSAIAYVKKQRENDKAE
jgi:preprotein translocase subunit YajC